MTGSINASGRALFSGEVQEAKKVFGDKIDYSKVKVIDGPYTRLQGVNDVCTPNGKIYWPDANKKTSLIANPVDAHIFIHEMTHVFQHQSGVNVKVKGCLALAAFVATGCKHANPYVYKAGKPWSKYNIEQQAELVADAYCQDYSVFLKQSFEPLFPELQHMPLPANTENNQVPLSQRVAGGID